jgi:HK97 family phage portal protein
MALGTQHVSPVTDQSSGKFLYWNISIGKTAFRATLDELIHLKYTNPDSRDQIMGIGPMQAAARAIAADAARQRYDEKFFINGARLSLALTYNPPESSDSEGFLTDDQLKQIRAAVEDRYQGVDNAHGVAIVHGNMKLQELGMSQKEMDFIEGRKWTRQEIAAVFRIPSPLLNDYQHAGLGREGISVAQRMLYENNIAPKLNRMSSVFQRAFVEKYAKGFVGGFDLDAIPAMREDMGEKSDIAVKYFTMGFPINQINRVLKLGFDPVPWGDDWLIPMNMVPARSVAGPESMLAGVTADPNDIGTIPDLTDDSSTGDSNKSDDKRLAVRSTFRNKAAKQFEDRIDPLQLEYARKLHSFLYDIRSQVMREVASRLRRSSVASKERALTRVLVDDLVEGVMFDVEKAQKTVEKFARKYYESAIEAGVEHALQYLNSDKPVIGVETDAVQDFLERKEILVRNIPPKIEAAVKQVIRESLMISHQNGEALNQQALRIQAALREMFTATDARARKIARTEMLSAVNYASYSEYAAHGIDRVQWLSSQDSHVRETHLIDGQVREIGQLFSTRCRYPGDPEGPAEECVNCRCTLLPLVG